MTTTPVPGAGPAEHVDHIPAHVKNSYPTCNEVVRRPMLSAPPATSGQPR
ncbi:hypothetical protein [Catellatospora bangladeshensis]|uniref:Uncharacterized protein n=1 Tax=Catellatospora bangladeshensis TaxID=310355 RepID=A0A8J3JUT4_9ACTN|nr:hypothetical protein [Catellatospora bangladeshensis]GIF83529.1 hypothetical protein Cba03nite_48780 [Catellatospora bangladeshensis]